MQSSSVTNQYFFLSLYLGYAQTNRFLYLFISDRDKITLNHQVTLVIQAIRLKTPRHYLIFAGQLCPKKDDHLVGVQLMMNHQATKWYDVDIIRITFCTIDSKVRVYQTSPTYISLHY